MNKMDSGKIEMTEVDMINNNMTTGETWEECLICMEPTNFDYVTSQYWVCCGQRMCTNCCDNHTLAIKGERKTCPFCRASLMYYNDPKYLSQLLLWAEKGRSWAQVGLAELYCDSAHAEKNIEKAIYYFELAAAEGQQIALFNLGDIYLFGNGEEGAQLIDYEKALHYFKLAAEGGSTNAYSNIGFMYDQGLGVNRSDENAFGYYKLAADKGDGDAQYNVGLKYYVGRGVEKDRSLSIKYLSLSADQNDNAVIFLAQVLIEENKRDSSYLLQAIHRTKCALKIMNEADEHFTDFKNFLEVNK